MNNNNTVTVNGTVRTVLNALSCGPGCPAHTYELKGGDYVYEIAGRWLRQVPGHSPFVVTVEKGGR